MKYISYLERKHVGSMPRLRHLELRFGRIGFSYRLKSARPQYDEVERSILAHVQEGLSLKKPSMIQCNRFSYAMSATNSSKMVEDVSNTCLVQSDEVFPQRW